MAIKQLVVCSLMYNSIYILDLYMDFTFQCSLQFDKPAKWRFGSFIRWFIASVAILMLALFLFGRKKGYSSLSYWINSIAVSIIIPHVGLWIYLMRAFN